ncbi:hypothetical protein H1P_2800006 [Hyella patelloides LEGE 07179]|uniref:Uncharacterized protein n=1 Tax=Hyella patelloides LEGE 07179 TaxID=945734 RepID=A0A563VT99_9CYAN|nr:hypothetical protein H1P_2800006 [Hyella patelloides LEGE 07179]
MSHTIGLLNADITIDSRVTKFFVFKKISNYCLIIITEIDAIESRVAQ